MKTVLKRLGLLLLTLLLVTAFAFLAFSVIPGDPTGAILGTEATDEQIAALRTKLGLDLPLWQRYLIWVGNFVTGNFGESYSYEMPVARLLAPLIPVTMTVAAMAFVLIVAISLPVGILAARHAGKIPDRTLTVLNQVVMSVPGFILGIGLTYLFSLVLHWFTLGNFSSSVSNGLGAYIGYLFFPALAIALPKSAMVVKMLRGAILAELDQDYVRTAYSKGNSMTSALRRHVLRNAMIPVVTFLAVTVADIMAGSIVVEQVFAIPGVGQMLVTSINNKDYPVVQAIIVLIGTVVVLCNFAADALYRVMDPRLRES